MAVTSETPTEIDNSEKFRRSMDQASAVNRSGRVFFGSVLLISALGLWLIPVQDGDAAMQLIKLAISLFMLALGAMFISSIAERGSSPDILIDTQKRELRILTKNEVTNSLDQSIFKLDQLTAVSLKNGEFSAHDQNGEFVVSVPVRDRHTRKALIAALDLDA